MEIQGFSTKAIHAGSLKNDVHHSLHFPIYSNAAFEFETSEQIESAFAGRQPDHVYSRISNPTVENLESQIKSLTDAQCVTALSSGMAAISNLVFTLLESGNNLITSKHLFGNSYSFFNNTIRDFGIETKFCDLTRISEIEKLIDGNTKLIFFETITNPQLEVVDIIKLSEIATKHHLIMVADTTITPPNIFQAKKFGINLEVVSGTKIISGGGTSIGGLLIDYGNYDWGHINKLKALAGKFGPFAFNYKLRKEIFRNFGSCLSPYHAYLQSLGLETLELRYNKSVENSFALAQFLQLQKQVREINYPGLESSRYFELSNSQFSKKPGAVLTFSLEFKNIVSGL